MTQRRFVVYSGSQNIKRMKVKKMSNVIDYK